MMYVLSFGISMKSQKFSHNPVLRLYESNPTGSASLAPEPVNSLNQRQLTQIKNLLINFNMQQHQSYDRVRASSPNHTKRPQLYSCLIYLAQNLPYDVENQNIKETMS